jgi:hypothetical protein
MDKGMIFVELADKEEIQLPIEKMEKKIIFFLSIYDFLVV